VLDGLVEMAGGRQPLDQEGAIEGISGLEDSASLEQRDAAFRPAARETEDREPAAGIGGGGVPAFGGRFRKVGQRRAVAGGRSVVSCHSSAPEISGQTEDLRIHPEHGQGFHELRKVSLPRRLERPGVLSESERAVRQVEPVESPGEPVVQPGVRGAGIHFGKEQGDSFPEMPRGQNRISGAGRDQDQRKEEEEASQ
jgi:hypothetical protein